MDKRKVSGRKSPRQGSRPSEAEQQAQLALAQQLGMEFLDPNLLGYASGLFPSGMDPQQLMNPMAYPLMNPAALQALTGLGGSFGGQSGTTGAAEWWNIAQNQALAASLGAGFYPGMLPGGFPALDNHDSSQKRKSSSATSGASTSKEPFSSSKKQTDSVQRTISPFSSSKLSLKPGSSGSTLGRSQQHDRKRSSDSQQSTAKESRDGRCNDSSPFNATQLKHNVASHNSSWMDSQQQQKLNEQVMQAELMRQLEQQFLVQQLHLQQQQQQDQLTAALQSVMSGAGGSLPGLSSSSSSQKKVSMTPDKMQEQITAMFQQLLQGGDSMSSGSLPEGMSPAVAASLFSTPGAMEAVMAMSQMGNMQGLSALKGADPSKHNHTQQDKKSSPKPGPSNDRKSMFSPQSRHKQHSSPRKSLSRQNDLASMAGLPLPYPGIPGAELSPDNALLATLYSHQLQQQQYEALIKQEMEAAGRLRDLDTKSSFRNSLKSKPVVKQESHFPSQQHSDSERTFASPSVHSRANLYSPANSTSSRGKSHISPRRDSPHSPSSKTRGMPERSQSRSSGASSSRRESPKRSGSHSSHRQENVSDTMKLFSTLASNPNLTQPELAALLSLPHGTDPALLLSSLNPMAGLSFPPGSLLEAAQSNSQMTPGELEKQNKKLAAALAFETQRLQEQLRVQQFQLENSLTMSKKDGEKENHISVIHQNNLSDESSKRASTSHTDKGKFDKGDDVKMRNGDAASSDGDGHSEHSSEFKMDRNNILHQGRSRKRRRIITNEEEVMEPLKHGWNREVRFKFIGNQLRGEVLYISPIGKKFRTYPDVVKHLEDNKITNLHRNNFSFSSRLRIGSFYEQKDKSSRQWVRMTEEELEKRIQQLEGYRGQYQSLSPYTENHELNSDSPSSAKNEEKHNKEEDQAERDRQKEKMLRQQEKLQKLEQQRIEREIRERIAAEERQKVEEARRLKFEETLHKAKELERQRMAEAIDRDQRRQQMLLMRALESRKRAEERERRREEIRVERVMQRQKKLEQRRIAMQIARELKMPVEDMSTIGAPELPKITPFQGTYNNKCKYQLSGNATADLLMVLEFVRTFKESLRIEENIIPSLDQLQLGLLNDPTHTAVVVQLTMTLLHQCLCDPGVPAPGPWLHCLTGIKVTDIDVTEDNYSEILRLFIWARNGYKTEISVRLESLPFPSLSADEKAQSLAFLVNELVCSRPICMEIEKNLDTLATLRRDKWIVEGQMRQLRVAHERNIMFDSPIVKLEEEENSNSSTSPKKALQKNSVDGDAVKEEDQEMSPESIFQKKMGELTQQHSSFNNQLVNNSKPLRAVDLGQDRFKRRYWVLPNLGGVYVEGLESGISYEDDEESPDEDDDDNDEEEGEDQKVEKVQEEDLKANGNDHPTDGEAEEAEDEKMEADEVENQKKEDDGDDKFSDREDVEDVGVVDSSDSLDEVSEAEVCGQVDEQIDNVSDSEECDRPAEVEESKSLEYANDDTISEERLVEVPVAEATDSSLPSVEDDTPGSPDLVEPVESVDHMSSYIHNHVEDEATKSPRDSTVQDVQASTEHGIRVDELKNQTHIAVLEPALLNDVSDDAKEHALDGMETSVPEDRVSGEILPRIEPSRDGELSTGISEVESESSQDKTENEVPDPVPTSTSLECPTGNDVDSVVSVARMGAIRTLQAQDESSKRPHDIETDSVLVAAKAIAAKAVASSSHLLFPKNLITSSDKEPESKVSAEEIEPMSIGSHTISALLEMGVNPSSLTHQQLEVLSHLESSTVNRAGAEEREKSGKNVHSHQDGSYREDGPRRSSKEDSNSKSPGRKTSLDQDVPMDLSCSIPADKDETHSRTGPDPVPHSVSASPCSVSTSSGLVNIKQEPSFSYATSNSPFHPLWGSPDVKYSGEKFFVPIAYHNNVKSEPSMGQQHYNQILSACPSPNTLANYIVSSANYSQFPSLEDIKFPIRAPDVKEEPDAIPRDRKRGWWRIESEIELRRLCEKLHLRGIREKQLHRNITKNFEVCTTAMFDAVLPEHTFVVFKNEEAAEKEEKEKDEEEPVKDREENGKEDVKTAKKHKAVPPKFQSIEDLALSSEMKVLLQVEELSEKCCNMAVVSPQWKADNPRPSMCREELTHVPLGPLRDAVGSEIKFDVTNPITHDPKSALGAAVELLGCLERAVCRRYLKPPLVRKGGATEFSSLPSLSESGAMDVAAGLRTWRNAIASSSSASQLSLCVRMLEMCIAWNKSANSPVKADPVSTSKSKKRKPEKRATPKSVDGGDTPKKKRKKTVNVTKKGTSASGANSKKPKKSRMPIDTADVISKSVPNSNDADTANDSEKPLVNGGSVYEDGSAQEASASVNYTEVNNVDYAPPENGKVEDEEGSAANGLDGGLASPHADYHTNSDNVSEEYRPSSEVKKKKKKKKSKKSKSENTKSDEEKKSSKEKKKLDKDTSLCRAVLRELQSHEAATWFLFPVDCKLVPGYRKIIKRPIDFHTIESRLKKGRYKSRDEFVAEIRLVFDNCQRFNEDDSNIGRAGHELRNFFERRWQEVVAEKYGSAVTVAVPEGVLPPSITMDDTEAVSPLVDDSTDAVLEEPEIDSEGGT